MQASPRCVALIKEFEGFSATPYDDVAGCLTWGYGHLGRHGEQPPECISEEAATALLGRDLAEAEACVNAYVSAILNQDQFDALCSFVFNLGCGALKRSTLLKLLNAGDFDSAAVEFGKWCYAGGKPVRGLLRRRMREQDLFLGRG